MSQNYDEEYPELNVPLLRKGLEWVEEQARLPEIDREWDQVDWVSPPLNRANRMMHDLFGPRYRGLISQRNDLSHHCGTSFCFAGYVGQLCDERYFYQEEVDDVHVAVYARRVLGLSEAEANELFEGGNTAEDIRRICEEISGQKL